MLLKKEKPKKQRPISQFTSETSQISESAISKQQLFSIFEVDYDFYFKNNQGLFVMQTYLQQKLLKQIKRKVKLPKLLQEIPQFLEMKKELYKEDIYAKFNTLCFDIENVFIRKVNLDDNDEFTNFVNDPEQESNYICINHISRSDID